MAPKNFSTPPPSLSEVKEQFKNWRRTRKSPRPIPEQLWEAAVSLTAKHSVSQISKELVVDYSHDFQLVITIGIYYSRRRGKVNILFNAKWDIRPGKELRTITIKDEHLLVSRVQQYFKTVPVVVKVSQHRR